MIHSGASAWQGENAELRCTWKYDESAKQYQREKCTSAFTEVVQTLTWRSWSPQTYVQYITKLRVQGRLRTLRSLAGCSDGDSEFTQSTNRRRPSRAVDFLNKATDRVTSSRQARHAVVFDELTADEETGPYFMTPSSFNVEPAEPDLVSNTSTVSEVMHTRQIQSLLQRKAFLGAVPPAEYHWEKDASAHWLLRPGHRAPETDMCKFAEVARFTINATSAFAICSAFQTVAVAENNVGITVMTAEPGTTSPTVRIFNFGVCASADSVIALCPVHCTGRQQKTRGEAYVALCQSGVIFTVQGEQRRVHTPSPGFRFASICSGPAAVHVAMRAYQAGPGSMLILVDVLQDTWGAVFKALVSLDDPRIDWVQMDVGECLQMHSLCLDCTSATVVTCVLTLNEEGHLVARIKDHAITVSDHTETEA